MIFMNAKFNDVFGCGVCFFDLSKNWLRLLVVPCNISIHSMLISSENSSQQHFKPTITKVQNIFFLFFLCVCEMLNCCYAILTLFRGYHCRCCCYFWWWFMGFQFFVSLFSELLHFSLCFMICNWQTKASHNNNNSSKSEINQLFLS